MKGDLLCMKTNSNLNPMLIILMFSLETSWGLNTDKCETSLSMMLASQDWPHIKIWWMMLEQIGKKAWSRREAVQSYWELRKQVHLCCSFIPLKEALMLSKRWTTFLWRCECSRSTCWSSIGLFNFLNVYVQCMLLKLQYKFKAPVFFWVTSAFIVICNNQIKHNSEWNATPIHQGGNFYGEIVTGFTRDSGVWSLNSRLVSSQQHLVNILAFCSYLNL